MIHEKSLDSERRAVLVRLMAGVARGDRDALERVYQQTSGKLFGIVLAVISDRPEAEDVLQDVFITVWEKAELYDSSRSSPITWLAAIARNKAIDRRRTAGSFSRYVPDDALLAMPDASPSAFDELARREDSGRLATCLRLLEPHVRAAIFRAFLHGETYEEIARRDDVPLGTMKSWIRRGLIKLKGCLDK